MKFTRYINETERNYTYNMCSGQYIYFNLAPISVSLSFKFIALATLLCTLPDDRRNRVAQQSTAAIENSKLQFSVKNYVTSLLLINNYYKFQV